MKKILLFLGLAMALIVLSAGTLRAQSDKEIIKAANIDVKDKDYDLAFQKIITVSKPENKKVQEILKETYPNLIADYLSKATAVKINDKDSLMVKYEKLEQIIGFLNEAVVTDSLFKKMAKPDLYKSLSKKKKIESTLTTYNKKLKVVNGILAKQDTLGVAGDTAKTEVTNNVQHTDTTSNTNDVNTSPVTNNTNVSTTTTIATTNINTDEKKYYIIAGSYKSETDAQNAVNSLKALGYASEIVGQNAYGNYRISYSNFSNKDDAQKELEKIKNSVQADAWIFEK